MIEKDLFTADEVRIRLGAMRGLKKIRYDDWRAMLRAGLKGIPLGKRHVFRWSTVLAFLDALEQPVVPQTALRSAGPRALPLRRRMA